MGSKSEFWKGHLAAWRDSGMSQTAYCRQHELSLASFGYWWRRLRSTPVCSPALVPIVVESASAAGACIGIHLPNGLKVPVSTGLDPARLVPLIRALRAC